MWCRTKGKEGLSPTDGQRNFKLEARLVQQGQQLFSDAQELTKTIAEKHPLPPMLKAGSINGGYMPLTDVDWQSSGLPSFVTDFLQAEEQSGHPLALWTDCSGICSIIALQSREGKYMRNGVYIYVERAGVDVRAFMFQTTNTPESVANLEAFLNISISGGDAIQQKKSRFDFASAMINFAQAYSSNHVLEASRTTAVT